MMFFFKICCCLNSDSSEDKEELDDQSRIATENSVFRSNLTPQSNTPLRERTAIRLQSETLDIPIEIRIVIQKDDEICSVGTPSFPPSPKTVPVEQSCKKGRNIKPKKKRNRKKAHIVSD
jgi:hypothetical protein